MKNIFTIISFTITSWIYGQSGSFQLKFNTQNNNSGYLKSDSGRFVQPDQSKPVEGGGCVIDREIDQFTGDTTFRTPLNEDVYFQKVISYNKTTKKTVTTFFMNLQVCSLLFTTEPGVTILFEDGTKIEKPGTKVDGDVSDNTDCGYEMSAFFRITKNDISLLRSKPIKAFRLYIHDNTSVDGELFQKYLNCLLKASGDNY